VSEGWTEPAPDPEEDQVCYRCGRKPTERVFSQEERRTIHTRINGHSEATGLRIICGGEVGPKDQSWRRELAPGRVVRCYSTGADFYAHRVRLGRPVSKRTRSWSGTALCGATPYGSGLWIPIAPDGIITRDCEACERADAKRSVTELNDEGRLTKEPDSGLHNNSPE
jgi:hypothetical protein